jgi:hypothetical protein
MMVKLWGVEGIEGLFSAFVANPRLAKSIHDRDDELINTDDRTVVEYGFARTAGVQRAGLLTTSVLRATAHERGDVIPVVEHGTFELAPEVRTTRALAEGSMPERLTQLDPSAELRVKARPLLSAVGRLFRGPRPRRTRLSVLLTGFSRPLPSSSSRSEIVTMPTTRPRSTTGKHPTLRPRSKLAASRTVVLGEAVATCFDINSLIGSRPATPIRS